MSERMVKILSKRELEVASLVAKGLRNKEVLACLNIEEKSVKWHLTNIYKKLHVKSRYELREFFKVSEL